MGNAGSNVPRERQHKSSLSDAPISPVLKDDHAFDYDKHPDRIFQGSSQEEEEPYYTKPIVKDEKAATETPADPKEDTVFDEPEKKPALPTVFKWDGGGKQVFISGTFSEWRILPMVRSHGDFVTIIDLPEGEHEYKFYVDGEWRHDPKIKNVENEVGSKNNLISVRQSDFEVFQALAKDSEERVSSSQTEYSQDIPLDKPWGTGPPVLPPHLLQVILNKDTPLSCEPTLLPEPNHVMLNHLYALSIKDGVMVLSATHRYRKKYVTTLLYKPI